jgi:hypothetical protein
MNVKAAAAEAAPYRDHLELESINLSTTSA